MDWLHFLNLQYIYCVIYSFFGNECNDVGGFGNDGSFGNGGSIASTTPSAGGGVLDQIGEVFFSVFSTLGNFFSPLIKSIWGFYSGLAWGISFFLFLVMIFALGSLLFIRLREINKYGTLPPETEKESIRTARWEELLEETMVTDPKRWRHAILEADSMLGELLERLGYAGATTTDKMRSLPEDAFVTVPVAWEAHRIRNFISAGSSDFILTQREAFRVMKLYEQVFEEFHFI
ncbi:MAG: hypothetical protein ACJKTH_01665 [Patescibacteria group bacterium UBA2163]